MCGVVVAKTDLLHKHYNLYYNTERQFSHRKKVHLFFVVVVVVVVLTVCVRACVHASACVLMCVFAYTRACACLSICVYVCLCRCFAQQQAAQSPTVGNLLTGRGDGTSVGDKGRVVGMGSSH